MASVTQWPPSFAFEIPQDQLPISHRKVTILGLIITFQALAWLAVSFRMYCRSVIAHSFGWDDVFVIASLGVTTLTTCLIAIGTSYGMGQHYYFVNLNPNLLIGWNKIYYFSTLSYFLAAALIKISILFQYMRLFKGADARTPRIIAVSLIGVTIAWGSIYFFVQVFSCAPITDGWSLSPDANCRLAMSFNLSTWLGWYYTHALSNMLLDYSILLLPLFFRRHLGLETRGKKGLIGLFGIGGCVATISAIRLAILITYRGGIHPTQDATWRAPAILIPTLLEIQAAVTCASVPIFWPVVAQVLGLGQIQITHEVTLHSESRSIAPALDGYKRQSESSDTEMNDIPGRLKGERCSKDAHPMGWQVDEEGYSAKVNNTNL